MALTAASFHAQFPGFDSVDPALVQAKLDEALRRTPADIWGDKQSDAQGYLAAGLLWNDGYGADSAMASGPNAANRYLKMRARLEAEMAPGVTPRVT